jgi:hypothetical protein
MQDTGRNTPLTRGLVLEQSDGRAVIALPGSDYQLHLQIDRPIECTGQDEVRGCVAASALKVDRVHTGGLFIEPVYGRPRRIQGRVVAKDPTGNTLTIAGPCVVVVQLDVTQRAGDFPLGELVGFNVKNASHWLCE